MALLEAPEMRTGGKSPTKVCLHDIPFGSAKFACRASSPGLAHQVLTPQRSLILADRSSTKSRDLCLVQPSRITVKTSLPAADELGALLGLDPSSICAATGDLIYKSVIANPFDSNKNLLDSRISRICRRVDLATCSFLVRTTGGGSGVLSAE
jgi:hypothetical protein